MQEQLDKSQMRYSSSELAQIKALFDKNDTLIMALRKHFLQGPMTDIEKEAVFAFKSNLNAVTLLKKTILPEIDTNSPLFQCVDLFVGVATKNRATSEVMLEVGIKAGMKDYLESMFASLVDDVKVPSLTALVDFTNQEPEQVHINLGIRNSLIAHVDFQLKQLQILAAMKESSPEESAAKRLKDSGK